MRSEEEGGGERKEEEERCSFREESETNGDGEEVPIPWTSVVPPPEEETESGHGERESENVIIDTRSEEHNAGEKGDGREECEGKKLLFGFWEEEEGNPCDEEERGHGEEKTEKLQRLWIRF